MVPDGKKMDENNTIVLLNGRSDGVKQMRGENWALQKHVPETKPCLCELSPVPTQPTSDCDAHICCFPTAQEEVKATTAGYSFLW